MTLSILDLNINADNYWDKLNLFLQSSDFDIICLQEVAGKDTISGNIHSVRDGYTELQRLLGSKYHGELAISQRYASGEFSYMGNATFYKKEFTLLKKNIVPFHKNSVPFPKESDNFEIIGRSLLHLMLQINGRGISILNTHFAWAKTPVQQPHQTEQGGILLDYVKSTSNPFVLCGDFNLSQDQPIIRTLNTFAKNMINQHAITNTLNPRTHRSKTLFPKGVAVDYIFTSTDIEVTDFTVLDDIDLSDHLALTAKIEF